MSHELHIQRVAHIEDAKVRFGDLTVLVGPQATGKSILLQFHKLLVDIGCVLAEMKRDGLDWEKTSPAFSTSISEREWRDLERQRKPNDGQERAD